MDKQLQPKLRFSEFNGEWEVDKIGSIADIYDGTHQTPNYVSQGIPFVSVENINNIDNTDKFITKEAFDKYKIKPRIGDILMTRITAGIIGATSIVKNDSDLAYYVSLALIRNKSINNIEFINHYISTDYFKRELYKRIIHVAFPKKINLGDINQCLVKYSNSISEQQKIADYLTTIDKKIELLTEKKTALSRYKKAMMQKLFSQEIRFKPSEAEALEAYPEWEEKRLKEIILFLSDYTANGSFASLKENVVYYNEENYSVLVRTTDLEKKIFKPERFTDEKGYKFLKKTSLFGGEIILANVGSIGKVYKVPLYNKPMTLAPNTYVLKFNIDIYQDYIYQWMLTEKFKKTLLSKVGSSTLKSINKDTLKSIETFIPSLPEQQKIADFLSSIDESITKVEEQIKETQNFKKAMLQQMFV